jgi:alkaline phosphatase D
MFYVPLVRTLRAASEAVVPRTRLRIMDEGPPEEVVEEIPMERVVKYLPIGNYKWCVIVVPLRMCVSLTPDYRSAIEIDTRNPEHPKLNLEVVIDGKVAYRRVLIITPSQAMGILIELFL